MTTPSNDFPFYDEHSETCEVSMIHGSQDIDWDGTPVRTRIFINRQDPSTGEPLDQLQSESGEARRVNTPQGEYLAVKFDDEYQLVGKIVD